MTITAAAHELSIDGLPRILLCSSAFYFRIPRAEWVDRLDSIKASGYHAIDVYCPWNLHEQADGGFDFSGELDLGHFCDLAWERGLYVIARPGPYICSEWDGGALPARLGEKVRQADEAYLAEVRGWFDAVLPVIAERQLGAGGGVVMLQVENELDFFDCHDRAGYQGALLEMATSHGITVPVIACAGQGDLSGASGDAPGVLPTCNFYPSDDSAAIESEVLAYTRTLAERDLPLLVTETNREHRTLRRLLLSGARLISPYLQTSGYDFDGTPSVGNWGAPGNFMSHQYDFGGYLSSTGRRRPEFVEGRRLAGVVDTLGRALAEALPGSAPIDVTTDYASVETAAWLQLSDGGWLGGAPNLGDRDGLATVTLADGELQVPVSAASTPLWLVDLPLTGWGSEHMLTFCSADLVKVTSDGDELVLHLCSEAAPVLVIDGQQVGLDRDGEARVGTLRVRHHSPSTFAELTGTAADEPTDRDEQQLEAVRGTRPDAGRALGESANLEDAGIHRGRGCFSVEAELGDELLVIEAGDLVSVRVDDELAGTWATFGGPFVVPTTPGRHRVDFDVEIWGHPNFDDSRLPLMALGTRRGPGRPLVVRERIDLTACWTVTGEDQWAGSAPRPLRRLGGWSSTRGGRPITYERELPERTLGGLLVLDGLDGTVQVQVDDAAPAFVSREHPVVVLTPEARRVRVTLLHEASRRGLSAELVLGDWLDAFQLVGATLSEQTANAQTELVGPEAVQWPLEVDPAGPIWLDIAVPDAPAERGWQLTATGHDARLSFWAGDVAIGRLVLPANNRPTFSGGPDTLVWVPASMAADGPIRVRIDAWAKGGSVDAITSWPA